MQCRSDVAPIVQQAYDFDRLVVFDIEKQIRKTPELNGSKPIDIQRKRMASRSRLRLSSEQIQALYHRICKSCDHFAASLKTVVV